LTRNRWSWQGKGDWPAPEPKSGLGLLYDLWDQKKIGKYPGEGVTVRPACI
jgi:hypothetical protein